MSTPRAALTALAAAVILAGCGSTVTSTPGASAPAGRAASPASPFRVVILYTGHLSAAQQTRYGAADADGVVYRVTNVSMAAGVPDATVQFLDGGNVVEAGYFGSLPELLPGQSEEAAATNTVSAGGNGQPWTSARIISITDETAGTGQGTYPVAAVSSAPA